MKNRLLLALKQELVTEDKSVEKADIIIPVYKPGKTFLELIRKLEQQSVPVNRIIIMNTEQKYFDRLIYGTSFQKDHHNVLVRHLSRREFDHGRTRNRGVQYSDAEYFIMMTQDAVPADVHLIEELLGQLRREKVAVAYARQIAPEGSSEIEKYTRSFNYPEQSMIKTQADLDRLGLKTFFCSNVCAAYNRRIFDELGGFVKHTIFNEDMIYAARAVEAGYGIAYTAEAKVFHSHNYTNMEQFRRNFDLGVSQAEHPEIFAAYPSESEGIRFVRQMIRHLGKTGLKRKIPHVMVQSGFKYAGYLLGKHYRSLPGKLVVRMSNSKEYWS
ncbi:MAG: glycosyltransferase family 2 protein [Lachnospiraceae bacterium]|nr:glycosyltransferase family 2 protein [Lachnospiraceae bacterium]